MAGWQKVYRDIQDHWLWEDKPFSRGQAWIDLILLVNHQDGKALIDGELIEVKRGSKITSLRKLGEAWGWSSKKVKKFLEQLEKDRMISYKSDNKKTVVTIENYSVYQDMGNSEETVEKHQGNTEETQRNFRGNSEEIQRKTNKKDKECIKNEEECKEGKEDNKKKKSGFDLLIENYTSSLELQETLYNFIKMRKSIKATMTDNALKLLLGKLNKMANTDNEKIAILEQSIMNSWKGIFPLKAENRYKTQSNNSMDNLKALYEEALHEENGDDSSSNPFGI